MTASSSSFSSEMSSLTRLHVLGLGQSFILAALLELFDGEDEDEDEDELEAEDDEHVEEEVASLACSLILFGDLGLLVAKLDGLAALSCSLDWMSLADGCIKEEDRVLRIEVVEDRVRCVGELGISSYFSEFSICVTTFWMTLLPILFTNVVGLIRNSTSNSIFFIVSISLLLLLLMLEVSFRWVVFFSLESLMNFFI